MVLLTKGKRKKYLEILGFKGYPDPEVIKRFQRKYFKREKDIDGKYGKDTDILLRHVWNVHASNIENFTVAEFRCNCGHCTGYPDRVRVNTLKFIQRIRDYYKKPVKITSGLRCGYKNKKAGGVRNSKHLCGQALDYYISGVTDTLTGRKKHINMIKSWKNHDYSYGNGYDSNGNSVSSNTMGNAVHTQTK